MMIAEFFFFLRQYIKSFRYPISAANKSLPSLDRCQHKSRGGFFLWGVGGGGGGSQLS